MNQWFRLFVFDPFAIAGTCALVMVLCLALGYRRRRTKPAIADTGESGSPLIDEACLAILGLLLAFSFAAAYGKLDNRNGKIVDDANALRTLYYRCQALPDAHRQKLEPLIHEAVRARLILFRTRLDAAGLQALDADLRATEKETLAVVVAFAHDKATADFAPDLLDACHAVVVSHEARIAAAMDHVPLLVILLLIFVAAVSAFLLGQAEARLGRLRRRTIALTLLVSAIVFVTVDLEQPIRGFIQSDQSPIVRLAESMGVS